VDDPPVPELVRPVPFKLSRVRAIMMPRIITTKRSEIKEKPFSSRTRRGELQDMGPLHSL